MADDPLTYVENPGTAPIKATGAGGGSPGFTAHLPSIAMGTALNQRDDADAATRQAQGDQESVIQASGANAEAGLAAQAPILQDKVGQATEYTKRYQQEHDAMDARDQETRKALAAANADTLYDHPSVGQQVGAAIASGLLTAGTGTYHNVASDIIAASHQRQMDKINAAFKFAEMNGADRRDLEDHWTNTMHNMNLLYDAKLAHAQNLNQTYATRIGTADALAKAEAENAKLGRERADLAVKTAQDSSVIAHVKTHKALNAASPLSNMDIQALIRYTQDPAADPAKKLAAQKKLAGIN